jgi:hypothetical protein
MRLKHCQFFSLSLRKKKGFPNLRNSKPTTTESSSKNKEIVFIQSINKKIGNVREIIKKEIVLIPFEKFAEWIVTLTFVQRISLTHEEINLNVFGCVKFTKTREC